MSPMLFSLTQNPGSKGGSMGRHVPTLLRNTILWSQHHQRWALGDELLAMQSLPMFSDRPWRSEFWDTVSEAAKRTVAGDHK